MPRVSSEHLAARREQIVSAAMIRFGRNGFHATTMADVIEECGLSAGAVYRYFRGKDELVEAICERALGIAAHSLAELVASGEDVDPAEAVAHVVDSLDAAATDGPVDLRRVTLQAWAEALRAPGVMRTASGAQVKLRHHLAQVVVRAQESGRLPGALDVDAAAQVLQSLVVGRVVQHLLAPDVEPGSYGEAVCTLLQLGDGVVPAPRPAVDDDRDHRAEPDVPPSVPDVPPTIELPVVDDPSPSAGLTLARTTGLGWPAAV